MIINRRVEMIPVWAENKQEAKRKADRIIKEYNETKGKAYDYLLVEENVEQDAFVKRCLDDIELKLKIQKGIQEYFKHSYYKGFMENRQLAFYEPVDESLKKSLKRNKRIEVMMYVLTVILGLGIVMFFVYLKVLLGG